MFLYLSTNDSKYIEASFPTLEALEYLAEKSLCGIANVKSLSVDLEFAAVGDNMESFVLAETLKYMWLVFNPEQVSTCECWPGRISASFLPVCTSWKRDNRDLIHFYSLWPVLLMAFTYLYICCYSSYYYYSLQFSKHLFFIVILWPYIAWKQLILKAGKSNCGRASADNRRPFAISRRTRRRSSWTTRWPRPALAICCTFHFQSSGIASPVGLTKIYAQFLPGINLTRGRVIFFVNTYQLWVDGFMISQYSTVSTSTMASGCVLLFGQAAHTP